MDACEAYALAWHILGLALTIGAGLYLTSNADGGAFLGEEALRVGVGGPGGDHARFPAAARLEASAGANKTMHA